VARVTGTVLIITSVEVDTYIFGMTVLVFTKVTVRNVYSLVEVNEAVVDVPTLASELLPYLVVHTTLIDICAKASDTKVTIYK